MKIIKKIKLELAQAMEIAVELEEFPKKEIPGIHIEIPADRINGEISSNIALVSAKIFKMSPQKIAQILIDNLNLKDDLSKFIDKIEIANVGFINFFLSENFYIKVLSKIDELKNNYGKSNFGQNKNILVEFVSSNPTGPMHLGNARLGAIGDILSEILKFAGFKVYKEFYINDSGNQIKKFSESLAARYMQIFRPETPFPEDGYHGDDIKFHAQDFAKIHANYFLDKPELKGIITNFALPKNIEKIKCILGKYKIFYDNWFYESEIHKSDQINKIINKLKNLGFIYKENGAIWFATNKIQGYESSKNEVLIRSNGIPTYFMADIAYHANKFLTRNFEICINIWGADHHGHIDRMHAAMLALGIEKKRLKIIIVQLVRIIKNGEINKMSKRSGNSETLESLLDVINVDSAKFIFNTQTADSKMDFDLNLAVKNDILNPAYYVQYAYARINSIIRKQINFLMDFKKIDIKILDSKEERELIFALSMFPYKIVESAKLYDTTKITRYVTSLSALFHKFYNSKKIICQDEQLSRARLFLCVQISQVIKNVLTIMKVNLRESM
ncbi:MAG: arginine--tRNA ligase [Oscillospiraceae bacterium]|nr:arginine--tRNA ligase [Oscillospiraceae bacterium]